MKVKVSGPHYGNIGLQVELERLINTPPKDHYYSESKIVMGGENMYNPAWFAVVIYSPMPTS